jgi:predicted nucleic acid-binding protein
VVTYLDSSVAIAALLAETRRPSRGFWQRSLIASRLLLYEVSVRLSARGLAGAAGGVEVRLGRVDIVELEPRALARALQPFPTPVRTLDALHLATADYLRARGLAVEIATYDRGFAIAAAALGFALADPDRPA